MKQKSVAFTDPMLGSAKCLSVKAASCGKQELRYTP
jgi:hypothetical protein